MVLAGACGLADPRLRSGRVVGGTVLGRAGPRWFLLTVVGPFLFGLLVLAAAATLVRDIGAAVCWRIRTAKRDDL